MYSMFPFQIKDHEMTPWGIRVDLDEWRQEPEKKRRRVSTDDRDEFEGMSRSLSVSPSPNDIVNQTLSQFAKFMSNGDNGARGQFKTVRETKKVFIKCLV